MPSSASAPPVTYTLSLHDALPISALDRRVRLFAKGEHFDTSRFPDPDLFDGELLVHFELVNRAARPGDLDGKIAPLGLGIVAKFPRSEEHTSELQSHHDLVCRLLLPPHP